MNIKNREAIATNQAHFPVMALVYEIGDNMGGYVVAKIGHAEVHRSDYVENKTARKYKLYFDRYRRYYFKWNNLRFLLDETRNTAGY